MKNLYQLYSVPAMADPAPLEKRLRHILFGRGGYTMRHAVIPLVLGVIALGALLPLRFHTRSQTTLVEAVVVRDVAVAQAPTAPMAATEAVKAESAEPAVPAEPLPAQAELESVEALKQREMQLEAELAQTRLERQSKEVLIQKLRQTHKELFLQQVKVYNKFPMPLPAQQVRISR